MSLWPAMPIAATLAPPRPARRGLAARLPLILLGAIFLLLTLALAAPAQEAPGASAPPVQPRGQAISLMEAARLALAQNPQIRLAEQAVEASKGALETARGRFDFTLASSLAQSYNTLPLAKLYRDAYRRSFQTTNITSFDMEAKQLLYNGVQLNPYITVTRTRDTLDYPVLPASQATVQFQVVVPLLKGLGEEATGAPGRAAQRDLESAQTSYMHAISLNLYNAINGYWLLRQAQYSLDVNIESEARARKLLEEVRFLVEADQTPRSTMVNLQANLGLKSAQRQAAQRSVLAAAENLANSLGLSGQGVMGMPLAADEFPPPGTMPLVAGEDIYRGMAMDRRADLKAAKAKEQAAQENLVAALDAMKPKVNLTLAAGYNGLSEIESYDSYGRSITDGIYGPSVMGKLDFEFPLQNRAARGQMLASKAQLRQAQINHGDLARQVELGVTSALATMAAAARQYADASGSVQNYRQSADDERTKFQLGISTILDVIQVEDQLTSALLNQVAALQGYASALARLRYETGTLIAGDPQTASLSRESLTTPPSQGALP
ncbi:MAG: TolC family protein [Desulfarculus sp.]|nr:TolC family protein [Desulfarculus sp.]